MGRTQGGARKLIASVFGGSEAFGGAYLLVRAWRKNVRACAYLPVFWEQTITGPGIDVTLFQLQKINDPESRKVCTRIERVCAFKGGCELFQEGANFKAGRAAGGRRLRDVPSMHSSPPAP